MFYRGQLMQFADMLVAGTVDGPEISPVHFISMADPAQAAKRAYDIQTAEYPTLGAFRTGNLGHRP